MGLGQGGSVLRALCRHLLWSGRENCTNTPKLCYCPTPFQPGDSAGPGLVPALPAHPHITGQAAGRWNPQPLTPWAPHSSTTTPQRELGTSPAGDFAPSSCQDLLSICKSLSLKLLPVNTRCSPGSAAQGNSSFSLSCVFVLLAEFLLFSLCCPFLLSSHSPREVMVTPLHLPALPSLPAGGPSLTGHCSRPVYDEEEDALPQGCLSLTVLHSASPNSSFSLLSPGWKPSLELPQHKLIVICPLLLWLVLHRAVFRGAGLCFAACDPHVPQLSHTPESRGCHVAVPAPRGTVWGLSLCEPTRGAPGSPI